MSAYQALRQTARVLGAVPGIRHARQVAYRRRFLQNENRNLFLGVYPSFEEAARRAPPVRPLGYDNPHSARMYAPCVYSYDYAAMFWLDRSFAEGLRSVFDLGGHVGIKYHAFRPHMAYPQDLRWTVCDVPAVVERGRQIAAAQGHNPQLRFTTDFSEASGTDVLFASGSLQYLPQTLGQLLGQLAALPRRIILNITAVHPTRSYITLNSIGTAFCPYRVVAREELLADFKAHGYLQHDAWENAGKTLVLPFVKGLDLESYSGFCFDLQSG
ncbi:TIGR04325 family methyltransferase [Aquabacterium sp. A7-Y]|uniref:TIGR04325 family methyltransferase n=1 Tax=Aquabacterium sp. A7-Y TaxID=1349605 RepID=UPI00223DE15E|nr:TIGR04325 family methyltransferase [Aquabacterium sp. A7-Y]MCW7536883.1 TIGR04325 family methyltransferase [Aquabacterium sp. A7-Y]